MPRFLDLAGRVFGRLTVLSRAEGRGRGARWLCVCRCGVMRTVRGFRLTAGHTASCGCLVAEKIGSLRRTHGMSKQRAHRIWCGMKTRCNNPRASGYENYGGRGIRVCQRWAASFEDFLADMGHPAEGASIERIDHNGNYEPDNCRWATSDEQQRNTRANRRIVVAGEEITLAEAVERYGLCEPRVRARLNRGWPPDLAVFGPDIKSGPKRAPAAA